MPLKGRGSCSGPNSARKSLSLTPTPSKRMGSLRFSQHCSSNCLNSLIRAEDMLVAAVGLEDTLVVETSDAVLVAPLSRSQDVKKVVNKLKKEHRDEFRFHQTVHRPWGNYSVLSIKPRYQIKRITVHPGQKLSCMKISQLTSLREIPTGWRTPVLFRWN